MLCVLCPHPFTLICSRVPTAHTYITFARVFSGCQSLSFHVEGGGQNTSAKESMFPWPPGSPQSMSDKDPIPLPCDCINSKVYVLRGLSESPVKSSSSCLKWWPIDKTLWWAQLATLKCLFGVGLFQTENNQHDSKDLRRNFPSNCLENFLIEGLFWD